MTYLPVPVTDDRGPVTLWRRAAVVVTRRLKRSDSAKRALVVALVICNAYLLSLLFIVEELDAVVMASVPATVVCAMLFTFAAYNQNR